MAILTKNKRRKSIPKQYVLGCLQRRSQRDGGWGGQGAPIEMPPMIKWDKKAVLGTSANWSANPQIVDSRFWFADLRTDFEIYRKWIEIYRKSTTSLGSFLCNLQNYTFLRFIVSIELGGCINKYNTPLQSSLLWNDYFLRVLLFLQQNELA